MNSQEHRQAEISICIHLLYELRFPPPHRPVIEKLVDDIVLSSTAFKNSNLALFYQACVAAYSVAAQQDGIPTWEDVRAGMERLGASVEILAQWHDKYRGLQQGRHPSCLAAARFLRNLVTLDAARDVIARWTAQARAERINDQISRLCDSLMDIAAAGEQSSRPAQILREARERGWAEPMSTGYSRLDRPLGGGFQAPSLVIIGAPSGHGKSSLACNLAARRAERGLPTLISSLEMTRESLLLRMLCDLANVPLPWAKGPKRCTDASAFESVSEAEELLDQYVRVYDSAADLDTIARRVRRHQLEFGGGLGMSIIDHLGRLPGDQKQLWNSLEQSCYSIADTSKEARICSIVFTQVSEATEMQLRATNIATRIEARASKGPRNAADVLLFVCRHNGRDKEHNLVPEWFKATVVQTAKVRESGRQDWFALRYHPEYFRLTTEVVADRVDIGMEPLPAMSDAELMGDVVAELPF